MPKISHQTDFETIYEINSCLELIHYLKTREISLLNSINGTEFLLTSYQEAEEVAKLILELIAQK